MTSKRSARVALLLALAIGPSVGCASMKPTNWFSKSSSASPSSGSWTESVAGAGKGIGDSFKTMGSTMTSAVGKAKNAVVSTFSGTGTDKLDPATSLADMPSKNSLGPEIWVTNGQVFEMKGDYNKALDNYTKALEKEPDNLPALQAVARLHVRQEQYAQAVDDYQKVVKVSPTAENFSDLASAQQKAGRLGDAQTSIQKAISMEPSVARYRNNLAGILVAGGRSDEAVKELQQIFPPAVANYNVAYLHFMNKNTAAAQQHLQAALAADPNLAPARELMNTLAASQTGQGAVAAFNTANQIYRSVQTPTTGTQTNAVPVSGTATSGSFQATSATQISQLPQVPQINR
ncbi:MAG: tetratricopeptide repeat protein [Pirellulales bacterium]